MSIGGKIIYSDIVPKISTKSGPYAYINTSASSSVTVVDITTKVEVERIPVGSNMGALALTPNEEFLYTATAVSGTYHVSVVKTGSWKVVAKVDVSLAFGLSPSSMAATPDGKTVYVALHDPKNKTIFQTRSAVCAISTRTNKVTAVIDLSYAGPPVNGWPSPVPGCALVGGCGSVGQLAIRPNCPQLYAPVGYANKIAVIDTASNRVIKTFQAGSGPWLAFAPNGRRYYVVNTYNLGIRAFNASDDSMSPNPISPGGVCGAPESLAVTPNSKRLYVACVDSDSLSVIDFDPKRNTYSFVGNIPLPDKPFPVAITPNGGEVWAVTGGDTAPQAIVIDTRTNTVVKTIPLPGAGPDRIVIGKKIY